MIDESNIHHPDDGTLAAFADSLLDPAGRARVVEHLAGCAECRSIVATAAAFAAESGAGADVTPLRRRSRTGPVAFTAAAVAAALAILFFATPLRQRLRGSQDGLPALVDASRRLDFRTVEGRLEGAFDYRPLRRVTRAVPDDTGDLWPIYAAAGRIRNGNASGSAEDARALAAAHLLLGEPEKSARLLEESLVRSTGVEDLLRSVNASSDAGLLSDLAISWSESALRSGDSRTALRAVEASERAWSLRQSEVTAWNRALLLERAGFRERATAAWNDYLRIDSGSRWAAEAREHLRTY